MCINISSEAIKFLQGGKNNAFIQKCDGKAWCVRTTDKIQPEQFPITIEIFEKLCTTPGFKEAHSDGYTEIFVFGNK